MSMSTEELLSKIRNDVALLKGLSLYINIDEALNNLSSHLDNVLNEEYTKLSQRRV